MASRWYFVTLCLVGCLCGPALAQTNVPAATFASARKANALAEARDHLRADHPGAALAAYQQAFSLAAASSPAEAQALLAEIRSLRGEFAAAEQIQRLNQRLANPEDVTARSELIRLWIHDKADFQAAEELIDSTVDADLQRFVALALTRPNALAPPEAIALAEWLTTQADGAATPAQAELLARGLACYQRAAQAPQTDPTARQDLLAAMTAAAERLAELAPVTGPILPPGRWIDLTDLIDVDLTGPHWVRQHGSLLHTSGTTDGFTIPIHVDGTYDLQVCVIQKGELSMLELTAPFGKQWTALAINKRHNKDALDNILAAPSAIRDNRPRTLRLAVRPTGPAPAALLELDGLPYLRAPRSPASTQDAEPNDQPDPSGPTINAGHYVNFTWLGFRPVDGPATLTAAKTYWRLLRRGGVPARQSWQWVGNVRRGELLRISAAGTWSWDGRDECGPSGDAGGWHPLFGRIGKDGKPFPIGAGGWFLADRDGVLSMQMEDTDRSDNTGHVDVDVHVFDFDPADPGVAATPPGLVPVAASSPAPADDMQLLFAQDDLKPPAAYDAEHARQLAGVFLNAAQALDAPALQIALARRARELSQSHDLHPEAEDAQRVLSRLSPPPPTTNATRDYTKAAEDYAAIANGPLGVDHFWGTSYRNRSRHARDLGAHQARRAGLLRTLTSDPGNLAARKQVVLLTLAELDDAAQAAALDHPSLDNAWRQGLALGAQQLDALGVDDAMQLANWYESLLDHVSPSGQSALVQRAMACCELVKQSAAPHAPVAARARSLADRLWQFCTDTDLPGYGRLLSESTFRLIDILPTALVRTYDGRNADDLGVFMAPDRTVLPVGLYGDGGVFALVRFRPTGGTGRMTLVTALAGRRYRLTAPCQAPADPDNPNDADAEILLSVSADPDKPFAILINGAPVKPDDLKSEPVTMPYGAGKSAWWIEQIEFDNVAGLLVSTQFHPIGQAGLIPTIRPPRYGRFDVSAQTDWHPSLTLRKGDTVHVTTDGLWTPLLGRGRSALVGGEGFALKASGEVIGYLEGKIGDGDPFKIGSGLRFTAETSGPLLLRMHDDNRADNLGALDVDIRILKRLPPPNQP